MIVMKCEIKWKSLSLPQWEQKFEQVRRSSLLQSYAYARAHYPAMGQSPRWGCIYINGQEEGIFQIAEAKTLWGAFHALILDMGPLWYETSSATAAKNAAFFGEFNRLFPRRPGRSRRIIPNLENSSEAYNMLKECGFLYQEGSSYKTVWIDLEHSEEDLRRNLKSKWRNLLNKAQKQSLHLDIDETGQTLPNFLDAFAKHREEKKYKSISPKQVLHLFKTFHAQKNVMIAHVKQGDEVGASALILRHGRAATYQLGFVTPAGRPVCANYLLMWEVMVELKKRGVKDFDLGGVNEYDAKAIQQFKGGLGGEEVSYAGLFS